MKRKLLSIIAIICAASLSCLYIMPSYAYEPEGAEATNRGAAKTGTTSASTDSKTDTQQNNSLSSDICDSKNKGKPLYKSSGCEDKENLPGIITGILNTVITVCGVVSVIYVVIGGYGYMTSTGDSSKLEKAKKTIIYALIGLAICVLSFVIVNWIIVVALGQTPAS